MKMIKRFIISGALLVCACSEKPHPPMPGQSNTLTPLDTARAAAPPATFAPPPPTAIPAAKPLGDGFSDGFDRAELGPDWNNTGGPVYRLEGGKLTFAMAHNHPLWLNRALPRDVRVDFDCAGLSPEGDLKVELFGDGAKYENDDDVRQDVQYTSSGYIFIFGGWHNQLSTLVRQMEHAWQYDKRVPRRSDVHVEPGRSYHWTLTRKGAHLEWLLDGKLFLAADDPAPLEGPGHDRFAFEGWESPASCDNLKIVPLR